jgi:hypothetical protein
MAEISHNNRSQGAGEAQTDQSSEAEEHNYPLPKIDFSTFVLSINSSALVQLGLIEDPAGGGKTKNLALAKQTIDLLALLEEKTRGNLTSDEENILKNILYELRMLYVEEKG